MAKPKLNTVYKANGKSLEVNDDMLQHLESLGLSIKKPVVKKVKKAK